MTCAGNTYEINQDAVVLRTTKQKGQYFIVLAVCDGIGGLEHGEIASALTAQIINEWYDSVMEWLDIETVDTAIVIAHLKDLAEECNRVICEYRVVHQVNTGTTMSLMMILRGFYYIIQVGDSRVYCYRQEQLQQLTRDASVTKWKDGRMKQYLDNFLGKQEPLWFTSTEGTVQQEDIFLICSDGFYRHLQLEDIRQVEKDIHKLKKITAACEQLIDRMMERGEHDNISVGLIAVD
jgi:protein phosphatase